MKIKEAKEILNENGYELSQSKTLMEAFNYLKSKGYILTEDEDDDEDDDFEADEDAEKDDENDDENGISVEDLKEIKNQLKHIKNYEDFVTHLAGMAKNQGKLLRKLVGNSKLADDVKVKTGSIKAYKLFPTQSEIDFGKSLEELIVNKYGDCKNVVTKILSGDNVTIANSPLITYDLNGTYYIIDGHHRWSEIALINRNAKCNVICFLTSAGEKEQSPEDMLRDFQLVVAAQTGTVKVAKANPEMNMYTWNENQMYEYVYKLLQKEESKDFKDGWHSVKGHENDDEKAIANTIAKNGTKMQKKNPLMDNAPSRKYMPQTDGKTAKIAAAGMTDV